MVGSSSSGDGMPTNFSFKFFFVNQKTFTRHKNVNNNKYINLFSAFKMLSHLMTRHNNIRCLCMIYLDKLPLSAC